MSRRQTIRINFSEGRPLIQSDEVKGVRVSKNELYERLEKVYLGHRKHLYSFKIYLEKHLNAMGVSKLTTHMFGLTELKIFG